MEEKKFKEPCHCGACGYKNEFKKITNKISECKACEAWLFTADPEEHHINLGGKSVKSYRPATFPECINASISIHKTEFQKAYKKEDTLAYADLRDLVGKDLANHNAQIASLIMQTAVTLTSEISETESEQ